MTLFYGPEIMKMTLSDEAKEQLLADPSVLRLSTVRPIIDKADRVGKSVRNYLEQYKSNAETLDLMKKIQEYHRISQEAEDAETRALAAGNPSVHFVTAVRNVITTVVAVLSGVTYIAILMLPHHSVPFFIGLASAGAAIYINPAEIHRLTSCYFIGSNFIAAREAMANFHTSRAAQRSMKESNDHSASALANVLNLMKQQEQREEELSADISTELKEKIEASSYGIHVKKVKTEIENLSNKLEAKERLKSQQQREQEEDARRAARRLDEWVRFRSRLI